jgi:hypothetical protein
MPNPPKKRKVIGYRVNKSAGVVMNKGSKPTTTMTATAGRTKTTYTPSDTNTQSKDYKGGSGGSVYRSRMEDALATARRKKRDVTDFVAAGKGGKEVTFGAGKTTVEETPAKFKTEHKVDPRLVTQKNTIEPIYAKKKLGRLKARAQTLGGSNRRGGAATKGALGTARFGTIFKRIRKQPGH